MNLTASAFAVNALVADSAKYCYFNAPYDSVWCEDLLQAQNLTCIREMHVVHVVRVLFKG